MEITALKRREDFLKLRNSPKTGTPAFLMAARVRRDDNSCTRVGLTVTKKLGGAVVRNRIKRRLRAAVSESFPAFAAPGTDYVLIARRAAETRDFAILLDDMKRALLRLSGDIK
ncbi:MAG: ribonuclease P protein component [Pseudomonadota bacterium]